MTCEHCQAQLLEHLYGLLDDAEAAAVQSHLRHCGTCQAALAQAQGQQRLLAAAARAEFPGVRFEAPAAAAERPAAAPVLKGFWRRHGSLWAAAAAVLLVVGGLGVPGGMYWRQSSRLEQAKAGTEDA